MDKLDYQELIDGVNNGSIEEVHFSLPTYGHYKSCYLRRAYIFSPILNKKVYSHIELVLTENRKEISKYMGEFKDRERVFNIKGRGRFNLKDIYKEIEILSITYKK